LLFVLVCAACASLLRRSALAVRSSNRTGASDLTNGISSVIRSIRLARMFMTTVLKSRSDARLDAFVGRKRRLYHAFRMREMFTNR